LKTPSAASFIIDRDYMFLTPLDILFTFFGLIVLTLLIVWIRNQNKDKSYYRYILPGFLFKVAFILANSIFYIIVYEWGGDSIGFWDGSVKLNNLFWENPQGYFEELWRSDEQRSVYKNFTIRTGYPDSHIYIESESFFVSKVASIFTFITFKGYLLMSLIFGFFTTIATMNLFGLVKSYDLHNDRFIALALFFIPSLSFWCGGISKDTLMWISICYFIVHVHQVISVDKKATLWNWLVILFCLYIMYRIRSFMIMAVVGPLLLSYSVRITKKFGRGSLPSLGFKGLVTVIGIAGIFFFLQTSVADQYLEEAAVINYDMTTNKTYGTNRYDLGITDYSPAGMINAAPASILSGIFRPFIWESLNVSLILNGIESTVLIFFTARLFFGGRFRRTISVVRSNEFLIFAFFFALILAFFAGFTSILFGVLVRFKAPVLPFLVLLLSLRPEEEKREPREEK
jgi:hypothetical protein